MKAILIITNFPEHFSRLADRLGTAGYEIRWGASKAEAVNAASGLLPALIVIDATVDGRTASEIARAVIMANAMANLGVVSPLSTDDFHEAFEGLGILAQLSPRPDEREAEKLMETLSGLG